MSNEPKGLPATDHQRESVKRLVDEIGEDETAKKLGLHRATVMRIIAGGGLYYATRKLLNDEFGFRGAS